MNSLVSFLHYGTQPASRVLRQSPMMRPTTPGSAVHPVNAQYPGGFSPHVVLLVVASYRGSASLDAVLVD